MGWFVILGLATTAMATPHRVMLDPGHGGSNPGAQGLGVVEKQVTLAIATRVAQRLRDRGMEVRMTRTRDKTLTLRQRVAAANQWPADVFISIHANASTSRLQRGFEVYVLTPQAVLIDGPALRADVGTPRPNVPADVAALLDDVERVASQREAADLAQRMVATFTSVRGASLSRGVRQDAHHVLLGATMPAVLVEVGFLDHPIEGRELARAETWDKMAAAIADAIFAP